MDGAVLLTGELILISFLHFALYSDQRDVNIHRNDLIFQHDDANPHYAVRSLGLAPIHLIALFLVMLTPPV